MSANETETAREAAFRAACEELAAAARRGAALLDRERPGWHTRVDLRLLNMDSTDYCVLGQLFRAKVGAERRRGYDYGRLQLDLVDREFEFGFTAAGIEDTVDLAAITIAQLDLLFGHQLDVEWRALILARQAPQAPAPEGGE